MKWKRDPGSEAGANVTDIEPCPNCQCRGRVSFKEWKVDEKGELAGLAHCGNCGADLDVIPLGRHRPRRGAPMVFRGTIEEVKDFQGSMLSNAICPHCGHDGLRSKRTRDRRLEANGLEQPHCDGCGLDVPVDVAAQAFLDRVKTDRGEIQPESLRFTEEVVAFIRGAYPSGAQRAN